MKSKSTYSERAVSAEILPDTVRKRCELLVRDSERLRRLVSAFEEPCADSILPAQETPVIVTESAARRAADELRCIRESLEIIPEAYRQGIISNIESKTPFSDFAHPNTWKKWKKTFLIELARNLHLI